MNKLIMALVVCLMAVTSVAGHRNHHNTMPTFPHGSRYINTPGPSGKYPGDGGGFWGRGPYYHSYGHGPGAHGGHHRHHHHGNTAAFVAGAVVGALTAPRTTVVAGPMPAITVDNYATYSYTRLPASKPVKVQKTIWVPGSYVTTYTTSGQPVQTWVEGHYDTVWTTEWLP